MGVADHHTDISHTGFVVAPVSAQPVSVILGEIVHESVDHEKVGLLDPVILPSHDPTRVSPDHVLVSTSGTPDPVHPIVPPVISDDPVMLPPVLSPI